MPDLVDEAITQFTDRARELRPHVDEMERLERAIEALDTTIPVLPSRRRKLGKRAQQALAYVITHPGETTKEISQGTGIQVGTLNHSLPRLAQDGLVVVRRGKWHEPAS